MHGLAIGTADESTELKEKSGAVKLTKHEHACVAAEKDGTSIVIDPGTFSPGAADIIAAADVILVTHEHADHVNEGAINAALADRTGLTVYAPEALRAMFAAHPRQFTAVTDGDELKVGAFTVTVHGSDHAVIHPAIPTCANVGFLLDGSVYHPGDAYHVPQVPVSTLLLPTSGPWMKFGEAIDYVTAVQPHQVVQIHEALLSETGQIAAGTLLGEKGPTGIPLAMIPVRQSLTI
jgi:L-ascorbate metabolism protein UlaG (beta-lactamase superfamily)